MRTLIQELQRRNVLRVSAAYVVTAWLLIQVAETVFPLFGFGDEPARITVVALVVLFLPALILAWVFELTPEGIRLDRDIDQESPPDPRRDRLFDRIIIVVLALMVAFILFAESSPVLPFIYTVI